MSSDAKDIAYVSFENNRAQVFTQNLASGKRALVLSSNSSVSSPAWSPDKKHLAITSTMDGNSEIYLIELNTKKISRLTNNISIDTEPAWSVDGKKIKISVTGLIEKFFPKFDSEYWSNKKAIERIQIEGGHLTADDCLRYGLANKIYSDSNFDSETYKWALSLSERAPLASAAAKRLLRCLLYTSPSPRD